MEIPKLIPCTTVFVSGPVRSGKTYLLKNWMRGMERSLAYDYAMEFTGEDFEEIYFDPVRLCDRLKENPHYFRIAYHAQLQNTVQDFHHVSAAIWQLSAPRWLLIDECVEFCYAQGMQQDLAMMLQLSRHNLLGLILGSQRIAEVNKRLTSAASQGTVILFNTTEIRDLDAIEDRWGSDVREAVEGLRPCIYNDATNVCEQHPQCVVRTPQGFKIVSLGDKIKSVTTDIQEREDSSWQQKHSQERPEMQEVISSERNSGDQE